MQARTGKADRCEHSFEPRSSLFFLFFFFVVVAVVVSPLSLECMAALKAYKAGGESPRPASPAQKVDVHS